jgi:hypothetical protein
VHDETDRSVRPSRWTAPGAANAADRPTADELTAALRRFDAGDAQRVQSSTLLYTRMSWPGCCHGLVDRFSGVSLEQARVLPQTSLTGASAAAGRADLFVLGPASGQRPRPGRASQLSP